MTVLAISLVEHVKQIAQFAEKTILEYAGACSVEQSQIAHERNKLEKLKKSVGERVCNMCLESRKNCSVIKPIIRE